MQITQHTCTDAGETATRVSPSRSFGTPSVSSVYGTPSASAASEADVRMAKRERTALCSGVAADGRRLVANVRTLDTDGDTVHALRRSAPDVRRVRPARNKLAMTTENTGREETEERRATLAG